MPKEVAERLKKLDVAPSLQHDGKAIIGEEKPASVKSDEQEKYPDIPEVDRTAFLAHLLGAPRFKKSYELFGGAVRMGFRTRTPAEDDACARAAQKFVPEPPIPDAISPEVRLAAAQATAERMRHYREMTLIVSLCDLSLDGKAPIPCLIPGDVDAVDLTALHKEFISTLPLVLLNTIRLYHERFETLTNVMMAMADKPGFWKAASAS
jgi:hypothetical protein